MGHVKHITHSGLYQRQIRIVLIGAGGTGSQVLTGLARCHLALLGVGHPYGIHVTVYDPDTVSESNIGRQLFSPADIGQNKAVVLTTRLNMYYGMGWDALPEIITGESVIHADMVIACVDTRKARRDIHGPLAVLSGWQG